MPELPTHPFIVPGEIEDTQIKIDAVLSFLQSCHESPYNQDLTPDQDVDWGISYVIEGIRDAVKYMRDLGMPQNVTKLEGRS